MTSGSDKIDASMNTQVVNGATLLAALLLHEGMVLVVQKVNNGNPAVLIIHVITESRGVDNGEAHVEGLLVQLYDGSIR